MHPVSVIDDPARRLAAKAHTGPPPLKNSSAPWPGHGACILPLVLRGASSSLVRSEGIWLRLARRVSFAFNILPVPWAKCQRRSVIVLLYP